MSTSKLLFTLIMFKAKKPLIKMYGIDFWRQFKKLSTQELGFLLTKIAPIKNSLFALNFYLGPCYIAWYHSMETMNIESQQIARILWLMNESLIKLIPQWLLKQYGKNYVVNLKSAAIDHIHQQEVGAAHPYNWDIVCREVNQSVLELDIHSCGLYKMAKDHQALGMFPAICRLDYLFASYLGVGFERTKTLGDGDECCNCRYLHGKSTLWQPELGFDKRK